MDIGFGERMRDALVLADRHPPYRAVASVLRRLVERETRDAVVDRGLVEFFLNLLERRAFKTGDLKGLWDDAVLKQYTLDGKTVYLVDCRFDDAIELLKQVKAWFAEKMPKVETRIISLTNYYGHDDPHTWEIIRKEGHAAIVGVGHC